MKKWPNSWKTDEKWPNLWKTDEKVDRTGAAPESLQLGSFFIFFVFLYSFSLAPFNDFLSSLTIESCIKSFEMYHF